jgi:hypothetical protein
MMIIAADPIDADVLRLRHEFLSLPGLRLTVPQLARMLDVRVDQAEMVVNTLVEEGFLIRTADGVERGPALHAW